MRRRIKLSLSVAIRGQCWKPWLSRYRYPISGTRMKLTWTPSWLFVRILLWKQRTQASSYLTCHSSSKLPPWRCHRYNAIAEARRFCLHFRFLAQIVKIETASCFSNDPQTYFSSIQPWTHHYPSVTKRWSARKTITSAWQWIHPKAWLCQI